MKVNSEDIKKFFKLSDDGKFIIFVGDTLDVYINERYEGHGCLSLENGVVRTIGAFDMIINNEIEVGLLIPAILRMQPSMTQKSSDGKYTYMRATFEKGDLFMYTNVVRDPKLSYVLYYEFIYIGAQPKFITYESIFNLFDIAQKVTGSNFRVPHTVFEILYTYPYRDAANIKTQYRLTDRSKEPMFVPIREVAHITGSTTSKLVGSYFGNALDAALINEADQPSEMEELLRK